MAIVVLDTECNRAVGSQKLVTFQVKLAFRLVRDSSSEHRQDKSVATLDAHDGQVLVVFAERKASIPRIAV